MRHSPANRMKALVVSLKALAVLAILERTVPVWTAEVSSTSGKIVGQAIRYEGKRAYVFKGIPYAEYKANSRYTPLSLVERWFNPLDASRDKPSCIGAGNTDNSFESEDCLYLNVYTPSIPGEKPPLSTSPTEELLYGKSPYPVLVHFLDGALNVAEQPLELVAKERVVVVTVSYRTSALGYLCLNEAANLAIKDQWLALEWINENIKAFNGDNSRVTLVGAGQAAVDIEVHLLNKAPRLFHRVWMSNKFMMSPHAFAKNPIAQTNSFLSKVGCNVGSRAEAISCIRNLPITTIQQASSSVTWNPCVDGQTLLRSPSQIYSLKEWNPNIGVVLGYVDFPFYTDVDELVSWEGLKAEIDSAMEMLDFTKAALNDISNTIFDIYQANSVKHILLNEMLTDIHSLTPMIRTADYLSSAEDGSSVFTYAFIDPYKFFPGSHKPEGYDIKLMFGMPCMDLHKQNTTWTNLDCQMSADLMSRLAAFIRSGTPNSHGSTFVWSEYSHVSDRRGVFNFMKPDYCKSFRNYREEKVEFWSKHMFGGSKLRFTDIEKEKATKSMFQTETEEKTTHSDITTMQPVTSTESESTQSSKSSKKAKDEL